VRVLLCPLSEPGYLYPVIALGRALDRRGAAVHALGTESAAGPLAEAGIAHLTAESYGAAASFTVGRWFRETAGQYTAIRRAARDVDADVLVTSVLCHGALLAAESLDLPVVVLGLTAHLWEYRANGDADRDDLALRAWRTNDMLRYYDKGREQAGLPARAAARRDFPLAGTALLLRGDPLLEHPGAVLPDRIQHVGPCSWEPAPDPGDLAEKLDHLDRVGKPVVYVHLGRIFQGTSPWPRLNAAFTGGPFQAVVELGRSERHEPDPRADLLVVREPWMGPLIDRAGFVLSNGTSAPVLQALLRGRALGVSPAGSEQPLLAAACVRAGVAVRVPNELHPDPVEVLRRAWDDHDLRARAGHLGRRLAAADGAAVAADVVERLTTVRPRDRVGA
jgi:UDP:flavonoid glycosyltransferase YjiC (YdhE family)